MTYTLRVHAPEAEPYTDLYDYDEVREAVEQEAATTVNELGSDILDEGTDAERELVIELLTDRAMEDLWRATDSYTTHYLPGAVADHATGRRRKGVCLSLVEVAEKLAA